MRARYIDDMTFAKVLGVGYPENGADDSEICAPSVVPNFLPPGSISPKTLPPMRLLQDDLDVTRLLGKMLDGSEMTVKAIAQAIGVTPQTIYNAKKGKKKVSLQWFLRLANVCGARLYLALPRK